MTKKAVPDFYAPAVAFLELTDERGVVCQGTAFHVGYGLFATARHVVDGKKIVSLVLTMPPDPRQLTVSREERKAKRVDPPLFPPGDRIDVALLPTDLTDAEHIPIGQHSLKMLFQQESYLLREVVVMGYPRIPRMHQTLVCTSGEINAITRGYGQGDELTRMIISPIARGGFSGGPVMVLAEDDDDAGDCIGIVTEALVADGASAESGYFSVLDAHAIVSCARLNGRALPDHPLPAGPSLLGALAGEPTE